MLDVFEFMQFVYSYYNCNPGGHSGASLIKEMTDSEEEAQHKYDELRRVCLKQQRGTVGSVQTAAPANNFPKSPKAVATGGYRTVLVCEEGSLWTWGTYCPAQMQDEVIVNRYPKRKVMDAVAVAAINAGGSGYTMALQTDGDLWSWGSNHLGQLGDGTNENRSTPVMILPNL